MGEINEADEQAEEADDAVGVEALAPEAEAEAKDAFLMSMVKAESPAYGCTVLSPDVVIVKSSVKTVKVPVSNSMPKLTIKTNPPSFNLATKMVTFCIAYWVSLTVSSSP